MYRKRRKGAHKEKDGYTGREVRVYGKRSRVHKKRSKVVQEEE